MSQNKNCSKEDLWNIILQNRNIYIDGGPTWRDFCAELPEKLPHIDEMCTALDDIRKNGNTLVIVSHDDTDGILSGVIAKAGLAELGFKDVRLYTNDTERITFYGKQKVVAQSIETLNAYHSADMVDPYLLLCDLNLSKKEYLDALAEGNWHLLVVDHHETTRETADAYKEHHAVCVNPHDDSSGYPTDTQDLCSAAILWKILDYFTTKPDYEKKHKQIERLQAFAGIATIADGICLSRLSRVLVQEAIRICREDVYGNGTTKQVKQIEGADDYKTAFWGLFFLLRQITVYPDRNHKLRRIIRTKDDINESLFHNYLAPILHMGNYFGEDITVSDLYNIFFGKDSSGKYTDPIPMIRLLLGETIEHRYDVEQAFLKLKPLAQGPENYIWTTNSAPYVSAGLLAKQQLAKLRQEDCYHPVLVLRDTGSSYVGAMRAPNYCHFISETDGMIPDISCEGHETAAKITIEKTEDTNLNQINKQLKNLFLSDASHATSNKPDFILSLTEEETATIYSAWPGSEDSKIMECNTDSEPLIEMLRDFVKEAEKNGPYGPGFPSPTIGIQLRLSDEEWRKLPFRGKRDSETSANAGNSLRFFRKLGNDWISITWYCQEIPLKKQSAKDRVITFFGKLRIGQDQQLQLISFLPIEFS